MRSSINSLKMKKGVSVDPFVKQRAKELALKETPEDSKK
jgi:hypothetical protein